MTAPDWLPALRPLQGEWEPYCDDLFEIFKTDVHSASFFGRRVTRRRMPEVDGKPDGFWHVTSEKFDQSTTERIPDLRRCERVPWIGAMINAAGTDRVRCWANERRGRLNALIALPSFEHVVILGRRNGDRGEYWMLITAYPVRRHRAVEFRREYAAAGEYRP